MAAFGACSSFSVLLALAIWFVSPIDLSPTSSIIVSRLEFNVDCSLEELVVDTDPRGETRIDPPRIARELVSPVFEIDSPLWSTVDGQLVTEHSPEQLFSDLTTDADDALGERPSRAYTKNIP
jgi:hypothetical protein